MKNVKELHGRLFVLNSFFRSYSCFIALENKCQELDREFGGLCPFTHIHNILLSDAVTSWCKLFGTWKDEGHWKKLIPKEDHDKFLDFMLKKTKLTLDEFNNYREEMVLFRNKWVVHHDVNFEQNPVPFFDTAHRSALALNVYIRENSDNKIVYDGPECMSIFGEEVAQAMLSKIVVPQT